MSSEAYCRAQGQWQWGDSPGRHCYSASTYVFWIELVCIPLVSLYICYSCLSAIEVRKHFGFLGDQFNPKSRQFDHTRLEIRNVSNITRALIQIWMIYFLWFWNKRLKTPNTTTKNSLQINFLVLSITIIDYTNISM